MFSLFMFRLLFRAVVSVTYPLFFIADDDTTKKHIHTDIDTSAQLYYILNRAATSLRVLSAHQRLGLNYAQCN